VAHNTCVAALNTNLNETACLLVRRAAAIVSLLRVLHNSEMLNTEHSDAIDRDGYAIMHGVLDESALAAWRSAIQPVDWTADGAQVQAKHAARNLLDLPDVRQLATSPPLIDLVKPVIGKSAQPVRGILFNKVDGANWKVPWHQDLAIAVRERIDTEGFGPWSVKQGVPHVQPPVHILERMLTLRVHIDDCDESNGPLRVIGGSHRHGKLDSNAVERLRQGGDVQACTTSRGGVVMMRPLLLHASSPAAKPRSRRIVHLEYAATSLPGNLHWYTEHGAIAQ